MRVLPPLAGPIAATIVATLLAGLAACVPRTPVAPPPVVAPPAPAQPRPAPVSSDWRDWPYSPGDWVYRRDARGSIALFGAPGADAALTLRCDLSAARLYLSRSGSVATPLTIRTSSVTRALAVQPTGGTPPYVAVALAVGDPLLDAMGFSRGRFTVERAGSPPLVLPAWAEVERVVEDCRP